MTTIKFHRSRAFEMGEEDFEDKRRWEEAVIPQQEDPSDERKKSIKNK